MKVFTVFKNGRKLRVPTYSQFGEVGIDAEGLADLLPASIGGQPRRVAWATEVLAGRHPKEGRNSTYTTDRVPWYTTATLFTDWLGQGYGKQYSRRPAKGEPLTELNQ